MLTAVTVSPLLAGARIDPREPRRFVGREDDVRVEAQLVSPLLRPNAAVQVIFEVQNFRKESIALDPTTTSCDYDPESATATLIVGAEVPDDKKPPRLVVIHSGEKKTFTVVARMTMPPALNARVRPRMVQLKLNYLGDVKPFEPMLAASSSRPAGDIFPLWIENNVAVVTNALPFDFASSAAPSSVDASRAHSAIGSF
jgi:hypothetical protein